MLLKCNESKQDISLALLNFMNTPGEKNKIDSYSIDVRKKNQNTINKHSKPIVQNLEY